MQSLAFAVAGNSSKNNNSNEQNALIKGVSQLFNRLFGHSAVLQSEINLMNQVDGVAQSSEQSATALSTMTTETGNRLDVCAKELETLADIASSLNLAKQMCDVIIRDASMHQKHDLPSKETLARTKDWEEFMSDIEKKKREIDEDFEHQREEVEKRYEEAGSKLVSIHGADITS